MLKTFKTPTLLGEFRNFSVFLLKSVLPPTLQRFAKNINRVFSDFVEFSAGNNINNCDIYKLADINRYYSIHLNTDKSQYKRYTQYPCYLWNSTQY